MTTKELVWREVSLQRPYEMETLRAILTHIASLTSRGQLVWEARCKNGRIRYLIGTPKWSVTRVQEAFKAHVSVQFTEGAARDRVADSRRLKISRPVLSLNTEVSAAMIRAALAAMTGAKKIRNVSCRSCWGLRTPPAPSPAGLPILRSHGWRRCSAAFITPAPNSAAPCGKKRSSTALKLSSGWASAASIPPRG